MVAAIVFTGQSSQMTARGSTIEGQISSVVVCVDKVCGPAVGLARRASQLALTLNHARATNVSAQMNTTQSSAVECNPIGSSVYLNKLDTGFKFKGSSSGRVFVLGQLEIDSNRRDPL